MHITRFGFSSLLKLKMPAEPRFEDVRLTKGHPFKIFLTEAQEHEGQLTRYVTTPCVLAPNQDVHLIVTNPSEHEQELVAVLWGTLGGNPHE